MSAADHITVRTIIAEHIGDDAYLTMNESGDVREFGSAAAVVKSVTRTDAAAARRGESTITRIEWRNVAADFIPPSVPS